MNRWSVGTTAFAMAIAMAGCCGGGSSGDDPGAGSGVGRFAGSWIGNWADPVTNQSGVNMFTIGTDGALSGTVRNETMSLAGTATGRIDATGALAYTYAYPGQTYTAKGTCSIASTGHLLCNTTQFTANGEAFGSAIVEHIKQ